ncbi:MAG: hypothetical protein PHR25_02295 [Clostridia bacterium]|nr:hypothetical protein [Clostridia bacterium]MDD4375590.1 hypothetical protein [Clostridia bacterium]
MKRKGISLIVLVITIIIMIIISSMIILSIYNNNVINKAKESNFKSNLSSYSNQLSLYIANEQLKENNQLAYDDLNILEVSKVKDILHNINKEHLEKIRIVKGKIFYAGTDKEEMQWAKDINLIQNPYIDEGLILWYDGIFNGGLGIHNDNSSEDRNIWKDLSGNNKHGTLQDFNYNASYGWNNNALKFNGTGSVVKLNLQIPKTHTIEIVIMPRKNAYNGIFSVEEVLSKTYSAGLHVNNFLMYNNCKDNGGNNYIASDMDYSKKSLITVSFNKDNSYRKVYQNTILKNIQYSNGGEDDKEFSDYTRFVLGRGNWGSLEGEIYTLRIYNRILDYNEIQHNYNLDKIRYGVE